jgi:hypothetical protein
MRRILGVKPLNLNGDTKMAKTNRSSPIIPSAYAIRSPTSPDDIFGTHKSQKAVTSSAFTTRGRRPARSNRAERQIVSPESVLLAAAVRGFGGSMVTYRASRCGSDLPVTRHLASDPADDSALDTALCFSRSGEHG